MFYTSGKGRIFHGLVTNVRKPATPVVLSDQYRFGMDDSTNLFAAHGLHNAVLVIFDLFLELSNPTSFTRQGVNDRAKSSIVDNDRQPGHPPVDGFLPG